jgi:hypothetical protein
LAKGKRSRRIGTLLFVLPIILVLALIAYAVIGTSTFQNGTLTVDAQTSSTYYQSIPLNVSASVSGTKGTTPFTISLAQGTYVVSFSSVRWFDPPLQRTLNVTGGKHSFAVGVYSPILVHVSINQDKFNATGIEAMQGVTPVVWVNLSTNYEVITSTLTGRIIIPPLQNYTYVFQKAGTYGFSVPSNPTSNLVVTIV